MSLSRRLEEKTLTKMMAIYCREKHGAPGIADCEECKSLLEYTRERLDKCPFGGKKPVCSKCRIHCYQPEMRKRIKKVMRYSGPRMIVYSPLLTVRYMIRKLIVRQ